MGILVWNFYQTFFAVFIKFWMRFDSQICPTRFTIKFLFTIARAERKVRLCVKLFDFFPRSILIRLTWNLSRFSQIHWRFLRGNSGKIYFGRIFQKFCANQGYPLPKLVKFPPTIYNFILGPYCAEKIHTSTFICCLHPGKEARRETNHKKKIRRRKARTFCFRKTSFVHSRFGTYHAYSLGILVWNFYQTFVTVSFEFWLRFKPLIRPTGLAINFLFITVRAERKVRLCAKLVDFFHGWVLIRLTWNLSHFAPNSVEILKWIFKTKLFRENFQKFCADQDYPLPKLVKFRPNFCNFFPGPYCAVKIHTSTFICCLHPGKETRP